MPFHVDPEAGRLREALLHRPESPLKRLTPPDAAALPIGGVPVAGNGAVPAGMGERTRPQAAEMLARPMFTACAGMGVLPSRTIEPGGTGKELKITDRSPGDTHRAIAAALGLDGIRVLIPAQDVFAAGRGRRDGGANVLAVAPGVAVACERSSTSNNPPSRNGTRVVTVRGSEPGRGRGGPRRMTCPLVRDA